MLRPRWSHPGHGYRSLRWSRILIQVVLLTDGVESRHHTADTPALVVFRFALVRLRVAWILAPK